MWTKSSKSAAVECGLATAGPGESHSRSKSSLTTAVEGSIIGDGSAVGGSDSPFVRAMMAIQWLRSKPNEPLN